MSDRMAIAMLAFQLALLLLFTRKD